MKPLLSELFLPCSGMHSPIRANRYPLTTITGAQRASGQTHSRARSHQGDADLRADRSTAYLVSCIRVRSAHGNSFDHLVGGHEQPGRHREAKRLCRFDVESRYKFGRRLHRQVGRLGATQYAVHVICRLPKLVHPIDRVRHETAGGDEKGGPIYRWQTMPSRERDNEIAMGIARAVSYHDHAPFRYVACERRNSPFNVGGIILDRDEYRLDP